MPACLQFLIQIIQQKVRQQREEGTALWRPFVPRDAHPLAEQSGMEKSPDEPQQAGVPHMSGESGHQHIVIDSSKELLRSGLQCCTWS